MYFKQLELIGFKSFAEKTVIRFESGVTAIVGPNGCGKSNISDAIRWVLGEQSAKSLRGSEMLDVIFNGSSVKEPLNLAEVSLILSNEDKILPIEYEEVTITRRLYRSGDSEYLINKNPVRLKDIHGLLMGTGIGTDNYSVIEQGQMDLILNSRPEDRRAIFEEAAGITKYKSHKKEALRKLEQTEQNLLRIRDIIQEVKRQIGIIERQAKKAENYKIEFEKLKHLELAVASREFLTLEEGREEKEKNLSMLKEDEIRCTAETEALEIRLGAQRSALSALEESMRDFISKEMNLNSQICQNQDRILMNRERLGELLERKENLIAQIGQAEKRIEELKAESERLGREWEGAKAEEAQGQGFSAGVEEEFRELDGVFQSLQARLGTLRERYSEMDLEKSRRADEQSKAEAERAGIGARMKRFRQEEEACRAEILELEKGFDLFSQRSPDAGGDAPAKKLETKLKAFKEKILSFFHDWLKNPGQAPGAEEEARLDAELKNFSEEIFKIQGAAVGDESSRRHSEQSRRKIEQKLAQIAEELRFLETQDAECVEKKKAFESSLQLFLAEETSLKAEEKEVQSSLQAKLAEREAHLVRVTEVRTRQAHFAARRETVEKDRRWVEESLKSEEELLRSFRRELEDSAARKQVLEAESARHGQTSEEFSKERDELLRQTEGARREREEAQGILKGLVSEAQEKNEFLKSARERVHALEMQSAEDRFEMDKLKERIFNAYQVDLTRHETAAGGGEIALDEAKEQIRAQREKLNKMGPVSLVAIEEHEEMKGRFEFLTQQEQDLSTAKEDLHKAILKINRTTRELFAETFAKIQEHFSEYFKSLFDGGHAELILLDEQDVLESGIDIVVRPPGKKLQNMSLLSGGEKALTAIALLFALFKVKPSPFCVLDEIDAPLDEANIDRFLRVLKEFVAHSQFILVTHNKRTMNLADVLYGITMAESSVSKVVSVRFSGNVATNGHAKNKIEETIAL